MRRKLPPIRKRLKIDHCQGHINLHKTQQPNDGSQTRPHPGYSSVRSTASWRQTRGVPYNRARGRAGKLIPNPHRNRTLVLKNAVVQPQSLEHTQPVFPDSEIGANNESVSGGGAPSTSATGWVTKRDRHVQLINSSIFDKESELRNKAIEKTRRQKAYDKDQREKRKINRHLQTLSMATRQPPSPYPPRTVSAVDQIAINGLQFQVCDGGSKLFRLPGTIIIALTPHQAHVLGRPIRCSTLHTQNSQCWWSHLSA